MGFVDIVLGGPASLDHLEPIFAKAVAATIAATFVGSLYVWSFWPLSKWRSPSVYQRDHPSIILRRTISLGFVCLLSPLCLAALARDADKEADKVYLNVRIIKDGISLWHLIGVRLEGLLSAILIPFFLTHILFLGSHALNQLEGMNQVYSEPTYWFDCLRDAVWLRNHIIAPATEEFVFRGCLVPLLSPALGISSTIFCAPIFFGFAHFHHIHEKLKTTNLTLSQILPSSCFQFLYTSLYGAYSVFLFARTGHVIAPIVAHAVCNHMGFPNFGDIFLYSPRTQALLMFSYVAGLVAWLYLLYPLTSPFLYQNDIWAEI